MIVGFEIERLEASRFVEVAEIASTPHVNVNVDIKLDHARMTRSPMTGGEVLTADYSLSVNYLNPSAGVMRFSGKVHYSGPDAEEARQHWERAEDAPRAKLEMTNGVLAQVAPMLMLLSQQMALPSPVPVPMLGPRPPRHSQPGDSPYHG